MAYPRHGNARRPNRAQANLPTPGHGDARFAPPAPTRRDPSRWPFGQRRTAGGFGKAARRPLARPRFRAGTDDASATGLAAWTDTRRAGWVLFCILRCTGPAKNADACAPL